MECVKYSQGKSAIVRESANTPSFFLGRNDKSIKLIYPEYRINFLSLPLKYEFNWGQG